MNELLYELRDHVAWLTLNRPEQLNALSSTLKAALVEAAIEASLDADVRVVVIRGAGGRAFSVGGDLTERHEADERHARPRTPMLTPEREVYEVVLEIPKPTLAVVDGFALGGGFELAMACDLRVASDDAVFGMPEARLGMGANFGSVLLPRLIPRAIALEMLYFAERFPASRMLELGLVNHVWPKAELMQQVERWVGDLASRAPLTLRRYKEMTTKGWELPIPTHLRLNVGPNPYTSDDRIEGTRAFKERRPPTWSGR